jgi:hypothetical protein
VERRLVFMSWSKEKTYFCKVCQREIKKTKKPQSPDKSRKRIVEGMRASKGGQPRIYYATAYQPRGPVVTETVLSAGFHDPSLVINTASHSLFLAVMYGKALKFLRGSL